MTNQPGQWTEGGCSVRPCFTRIVCLRVFCTALNVSAHVPLHSHGEGENENAMRNHQLSFCLISSQPDSRGILYQQAHAIARFSIAASTQTRYLKFLAIAGCFRKSMVRATRTPRCAYILMPYRELYSGFEASGCIPLEQWDRVGRQSGKNLLDHIFKSPYEDSKLQAPIVPRPTPPSFAVHLPSTRHTRDVQAGHAHQCVWQARVCGE